MKTIGLIAACCATALAAPKPCEELKAEIETKIQSAGVTSYTLEIVRNDEVSDPNMVVGSCENGTKKIIYQKNDDEPLRFSTAGSGWSEVRTGDHLATLVAQ